MPKYFCKRCSREFWGWGVYYRYKRGTRLVCPECEGSLVERKEKLNTTGIIERLLNGTDEAA